MNTYMINVRIADRTVESRDGTDRYNGLMDALVDAATGKYWVDSPDSVSLFVIQTAMDLEDLYDICRREISPEHDLVLIVRLSPLAARFCGATDDREIYEILEFLSPG